VSFVSNTRIKFRSQSAFAFVVTAPVLHLRFGVLERFLPGQSLRNVVAKTAVDQFIVAPVILPAFFVAIHMMEGLSWPQVTTRLQNEYWPTLKTSMVVGTAASITNFRFVPYDHRVLFATAVQMGWTAFLSWQGHRSFNFRPASTLSPSD
jgi:protein Mpv17